MIIKQQISWAIGQNVNLKQLKRPYISIYLAKHHEHSHHPHSYHCRNSRSLSQNMLLLKQME